MMDDIAMEVQDEVLEEIAESDGEDNEAEKDDIEYETKDPVKKYQFGYSNSLCFANKNPENEADTVSVTPGEGKMLKDIMTEEDRNIKAFPHLNNPNGSNGKDQEKKSQAD